MKAFRFSLRTGLIIFLLVSLLLGVLLRWWQYQVCRNRVGGYGFSLEFDEVRETEFFKRQGFMGMWALRYDLNNPKSKVHWEVLRVLTRLGPLSESALPEIIKKLDDPLNVNGAVLALGAIGPVATPALPRLREIEKNGDYGMDDAVMPFAPLGEQTDKEKEDYQRAMDAFKKRGPPVVRKLAHDAIEQIEHAKAP